MEGEVVGTVIYRTKIDLSGLDEGLSEAGQKIEESGEKGKKSAKSFSESLADIVLGVQTLKTGISSLSSAADAVGTVVDKYNEYSAAMNGVKAVASATGNDISATMQAISESTANGLLSQTDAAAAMKNLQLYGYSAYGAAQMIKVLTDAAVYNRQANYSVSEAVRVTTEGIRMENSTLSDAAGVTKNIAKMQEEYAASLGVSSSNLTQAQKAQAVYNGILSEGSVFEGNAEEYTNSLAGAQSKLDASITQLQTNLGSLFEKFSPIVGGIADWMGQNEALVAGIVTFVGVLAGAGGLIAVFLTVKKAIVAVRTAMTTMSLVAKAATGGFIALGVAVASFAAAGAVAAVINNELDESEEKLGGTGRGAAENQDILLEHLLDVGNSASDTAKKIADLRANIAKLTRDYERDLKEISVKHEETIADLTTQIQEANDDYRQAVEERNADFAVTLAEQERDHQSLVDELMTQMAFLQRYNNDYNREKLAQVEFALAKEQTLYQRETDARKNQLDVQNAADKASYEQRLAGLQSELAEELAFMEKHRNELNSVRDVILLDEIESLNERYLAQKASYEKQIAEAEVNGGLIGDTLVNSILDSLNEALEKNSDKLGKIGYNLGVSFSNNFLDNINKSLSSDGGLFAGLSQRFYNFFSGAGFTNEEMILSNGEWKGTGKYKGWATGGYTGRGDPDEVAGVVHKGEYVLSADEVDQSTGTPKARSGQVININVSGVFATSASERRKVAEQIVVALGQVKQARFI